MSGLFAVGTSTLTFTDDPLIAQSTLIKAVHIAELRVAIDSLRVLNNLSPFTWTDPILTPGTTPSRAVHVLELWTALNQIYQALGRALPTYTDPTTGQTMIQAVHIGDLRSAVQALQ